MEFGRNQRVVTTFAFRQMSEAEQKISRCTGGGKKGVQKVCQTATRRMLVLSAERKRSAWRIPNEGASTHHVKI